MESAKHLESRPQDFDIRPAAPMHKACKFSILSSERLSYQRHSGLVNLATVILLTTNSRLIIENLLKYGVRMSPYFWVAANSHGGKWTIAMCYPCLFLFSMTAYCIELWAARAFRRPGGGGKGAAGGQGPSEGLLLALNVLNISTTLVLPCWVTYHAKAQWMPGFTLLFITVIVFMKLISYAHVNYDLRVAACGGEVLPYEEGYDGDEKDEVKASVKKSYPQNITIRHLLYFLAVPTLCYQVSYPRSTRFRPRWLVRRLLEMLVTLGLMMFLVEQYILPTVSNSMTPIEQLDVGKVAERILKLAIPVLYMWLCIFYFFFHLWLNVLAELLRFGDRQFYKDWWNATDVEQYWRLWNMPVHKWMVRHLYFPCIRAGLKRPLATLLVFFFSAVFHELIIGLPLGMLRFWAFSGIMMQIPLSAATKAVRKRFKNDWIGNVVFWITFCMIGQPFSIMVYYHDYMNANNTSNKIMSLGPGVGAAM